ncbi:extracellular solute-binding protein [Halegenticoccus soli]|uniref:extracellular solute-binding protein n=1 Tax=Halegenticoccus soli TaxID=1985678 RepID=UPI000C6CBD3E|nr:extracellular solute-binding protein [Halegenticoccus soli]
MTESRKTSRPSRRDCVRGLSVGAAATLAGCIGGSFSGGSSGSNGSGNDKELIFWTDYFSDENDDPWEKWYKESFEEETGTNLKVAAFSYEDRRQKFLTGARSGNPDYIEGVLSHLSEFVKADLVEPIGDRAKELDYFDGYVDGAMRAMEYDGKLYGLPFTGNGRALIYRKDVFERHGLEPPQTAEEFLEVGRTINEKEDGMWAFHNCTKKGSVRAFQEWMSHVYQHEDNLYEREGDGWTLVPDAEVFAKVFDAFYYRVWAADDPIANPEQKGTGWQVNDPGFLNGQFAMIECGPWLRGWTTGEEIQDAERTKALLDEKSAVAHLPRAKGGSKGTYLEVKPVMVNANSGNKDAAWEGVRRFTSPESLRKQKEAIPDSGDLATPVHEDVESTIDNENWKPLVDVFETGKPLAKISWGPVQEAFWTEMQNVVYGKKGPDAAGKDLHSQLKSLESEV